MDEAIRGKLEEKIAETFLQKDVIMALAESLSGTECKDSFVRGVVLGRLYNSFYYQTRRIFGRNPTEAEIKDFINLLESKKPHELW